MEDILSSALTFTELSCAQDFKFTSASGFNMTRATKVRIFDFTIALICLIFLLPLMAVIAVMMSLLDRGSLIYAHKRIGRNGKVFPCLKFRTMVIDSEARLQHLIDTDPQARAEWIATRKLRRDPRITAAGRILRKTSLDEIPQLFNVLRGDMSIVGPRPVVAEEILLYGNKARYYYCVKPGITGLWQISGRNNPKFRRRVAIDVMYVKNGRLLLDLKILLLTIPVVIMARGSH